MANLNKVMLIGRLTRDPEVRTFANGGKVAAMGFAVTNRRKNAQTGQWEDDPCFLDLEAFNRGEGGRQLADLVASSLRKGQQVFIEGHLRFDQWTDREGQKRSKLKVVVDNLQFLEPRSMDGGSGSSSRPAPATTRSAGPAPSEAYDEPMAAEEPPANEDIPF
jgi:single-strand DNA-binding protein